MSSEKTNEYTMSAIDKIIEILDEETPSVNELVDILLNHYNVSDIVEAIGTGDVLDVINPADMVEYCDTTPDWEDALEEAVENEMASRDLMTWADCDGAIKEALAARPKTYKDMSPDEVWEHFCDFLGIPYNNVNDAQAACDEMCDKMARSTYAHEYMKNEIQKK